MTVITFPEKPREYDCPDCGREVLEFPPFANPPGVCVYCEFLRSTAGLDPKVWARTYTQHVDDNDD